MTEADTLRQSETQALIREAYEIVRGNLPKEVAIGVDGRERKTAEGEGDQKIHKETEAYKTKEQLKKNDP